jgi:GxxExxY protein
MAGASEICPMARDELVLERLTFSIVGAFYDVNNTLGFGFLEHLYVAALERELLDRGHRVAREVYVPVFYKGIMLGRQRLDMIVDERVVVETKSTYELPDRPLSPPYPFKPFVLFASPRGLWEDDIGYRPIARRAAITPRN